MLNDVELAFGGYLLFYFRIWNLISNMYLKSKFPTRMVDPAELLGRFLFPRRDSGLSHLSFYR